MSFAHLGRPIRSVLVPPEPGYLLERRTTLVDEHGTETVVRERATGDSEGGFQWRTDVVPAGDQP